jgi:hypothetical protein
MSPHAFDGTLPRLTSRSADRLFNDVRLPALAAGYDARGSLDLDRARGGMHPPTARGAVSDAFPDPFSN